MLQLYCIYLNLNTAVFLLSFLHYFMCTTTTINTLYPIFSTALLYVFLQQLSILLQF